MAETDKIKALPPGDLPRVVKVVLDPINSLLEGIGQAINSIAQDLRFWQKLVLVGAAGYSLSKAVAELRKFIKDDPDCVQDTIEYIKRQEFLDWLEEKGAKVWTELCAIVKKLNELRASAKEHDRKVATPAIKSAVTRLEDDGFPGVAGVIKSLAGTLGIELETSAAPTTPAPPSV